MLGDSLRVAANDLLFFNQPVDLEDDIDERCDLAVACRSDVADLS